MINDPASRHGVTVLIALPALPWSPWLMSLITGRAGVLALDPR
jgi:hypothetical protein